MKIQILVAMVGAGSSAMCTRLRRSARTRRVRRGRRLAADEQRRWS